MVVHIQHDDERNFYALDRLWKDCPVITVDGIGAPAPADDTGAGSPAADYATPTADDTPGDR